MTINKKSKQADASAEEKIKEAARKIFTLKGFAATRTRDIAEEAGINLALLNYYFKSKQKLFQLIMYEKFEQLFSLVYPLMNDEHTSLEEKIDNISNKYIDLLVANPELPVFVFSEIQANPESFKHRVPIEEILNKSILIQQLQAHNPKVEPIQFLMSLLGMLVFPFVARPVLVSNDIAFDKLMQERKTLVAQWAKQITNC